MRHFKKNKKLKYSAYKIFSFKEKIDSLPFDNPEILPPIHIRIKPTNRCNHNCWYCAYRTDNLQLGKDMKLTDEIPEEKMMEIIDDCIEMGVKAITFSGGGEPLLYPYMKEVLKKLKDSPIKFAALTNGSNLQGEIAELFAFHGTWIRVSMDGFNDESYSKYRNVKKGEFSKIIKNIANFKKLSGKCSIGVSYIIDKNNYNKIYEFTKVIKESGADSIKMSPCIVDNDGRMNNNYHQPIFEIVKDQIGMVKDEFADHDFEIFDAYHYLEEKFEKDYSWCPYIQICPVIGADLRVYACHDKAYNLDEGVIFSLKSDSFKNKWFSSKYNFFKINPSKICRHHCAVNEKNKIIIEYLDIDKEHIFFV